MRLGQIVNVAIVVIAVAIIAEALHVFAGVGDHVTVEGGQVQVRRHRVTLAYEKQDLEPFGYGRDLVAAKVKVEDTDGGAHRNGYEADVENIVDALNL